MLSNGGRRVRTTRPPFVAGSRLLYARDAHSLCSSAAVAGQAAPRRAGASVRDHCDLISAQIDGQTTVINPGRWPAARPPGARPGSIGNIIVLIP